MRKKLLLGGVIIILVSLGFAYTYFIAQPRIVNNQYKIAVRTSSKRLIPVFKTLEKTAYSDVFTSPDPLTVTSDRSLSDIQSLSKNAASKADALRAAENSYKTAPFVPKSSYTAAERLKAGVDYSMRQSDDVIRDYESVIEYYRAAYKFESVLQSEQEAANRITNFDEQAAQQDRFTASARKVMAARREFASLTPPVGFETYHAQLLSVGDTLIGGLETLSTGLLGAIDQTISDGATKVEDSTQALQATGETRLNATTASPSIKAIGELSEKLDVLVD